jgi:hypothetical protein
MYMVYPLELGPYALRLRHVQMNQVKGATRGVVNFYRAGVVTLDRRIGS